MPRDGRADAARPTRLLHISRTAARGAGAGSVIAEQSDVELVSVKRARRILLGAAAAALGLACRAATTEATEPTATATPASTPTPTSTAPPQAEPDDPPVVATPSVDAGVDAATPACRRTVCLTGAIDHESDANVGFRAICESNLVTGRIDDCRSGTCKSTFGTFPSNVTTEVWNVVFAALDTNGNGKLDAVETCELDLLGFSWGGVNAVDLARRMFEDDRVAPTWKVTRLVLLDPFQPYASITVPPNVSRSFELRHSVAPPGDCSNTGPLGPYLGIPATCAAGQACRDFDFSKSPDVTFGGIRGSAVGHCDVPAAARANVAQILRDQPLTGAPREIPVQTP